MKRVIASLIAGLLLGTAGIAGAASSSSSSPSQNFYANGIWCKSAAGGVACVAMDGSRYGIGLTKNFVMVMDVKSERTVFQRMH